MFPSAPFGDFVLVYICVVNQNPKAQYHAVLWSLLFASSTPVPSCGASSSPPISLISDRLSSWCPLVAVHFPAITTLLLLQSHW